MNKMSKEEIKRKISIFKNENTPTSEQSFDISNWNCNLEELQEVVLELGGIYLSANDINTGGHPREFNRTNSKQFYVINGYDIISDKMKIWLGKIEY